MAAPTGARALWRAVICNAFDDAAGTVVGVAPTLARPGQRRIPNPAHATAVAQARAWFEGDGPDYREVCALAEVDAGAVRDLALRHIAAADAGRLADRRPLTTVLMGAAEEPTPDDDRAEATTFLDDHAVLYAPERADEAA